MDKLTVKRYFSNQGASLEVADHEGNFHPSEYIIPTRISPEERRTFVTKLNLRMPGEQPWDEGTGPVRIHVVVAYRDTPNHLTHMPLCKMRLAATTTETQSSR